MQIYFDNDVASTVSRRDRSAADLEAIDKLLELYRSQTIAIKTSRQSVREMERAPVAHQAGLKGGLVEISIVSDDHCVLGSYTLPDPYGGCICNPLVTDIVDEELYAKLRKEGLTDDDAKNLMYAYQNGCDTFLTWDKGILNRRSQLEKLCLSVQIKTPNELVGEIGEIDTKTMP